MRISKSAIVALALTATTTFAARAEAAAPSAPSGPHPRIWLTSTTLAAMTSKMTDASSATSRMIAMCEDVVKNPGNYTSGVYRGYEWAYAAASCGAAWQLTKNTDYAAAGLTMFNALLNDSAEIGDGLGGDTVVQQDSGYAIRYFGAYSAVAYDWLHDAPNASADLTLARERFKTWIDWYDSQGYLRDTPGSNEESGYVLAKSLIGVAASGEDDGSAAGYFSAVIADQFGQDIIGKGLGAGGSLVGGDWPEGWEYGPLCVLEYSLAARALEEQGASLPQIDSWRSDLTLRYLYGMTPDRTGTYVGGDYGTADIYAIPSSEPLLATLVGTSSDDAAAWAAQLRADVVTEKDDNPIYDALAELRTVTPVDYTKADPSPFYVAKGTRNVYVRSSWDASAMWAVFTSAPRLGPDHQHLDSSNFVFSRGADAIIADPSPYASLSTLTGNAISVDSQTVESTYRPSQSPESTADLAFARATSSGIAGARSSLSNAFADSSGTTDVAFAQRDWTFLPEGEVITIDRMRSGSTSRSTYLRFRSASSLSLSSTSPITATGTLGTSRVVIHGVELSGGTPAIKSYVGNADDPCDNGPFGVCTAARFNASEYSVTIPGATSLAIHVIDGLGTSEAAADVASMQDATVDTKPSENAGVIGARVDRNGTITYVVASSAQDGVAGAQLTYGTPGDSSSRHVVYDAPQDASGTSSVAAVATNGRCIVTITAGGAFTANPLVFSLATAASGCTTSEDAPATAASTGASASAVPASASSSASTSNSASSSSAMSSAGTSASQGSSGISAPDGSVSASSSAPSTPSSAADLTPQDSSDGSGCSASTRGSTPREGVMWLAAIGAVMIARRRRKGSEGDSDIERDSDMDGAS